MSPEAEDRISVVITAYDCASYLGQAIEGVLGQSRHAQQLIVIDDGSTDNCAEVVRGYGTQVQYHHQSNRGSATARNAGIELASGDWVAFLDGDDYWEPGKLAVQLAAAAADTAIEAIFGHIQHFASPDLSAAERDQILVPPDPMPGYHASTMLIRRAALCRVGRFDEHFQIGEFVDWYGRAMDASLSVLMLPDLVAWRRIHLNNSTRRNRDRRAEYARVLKALLDRRRLPPRTDKS